MARSRRARCKAAIEKSSKAPDNSRGAPTTNNRSNPNLQNANQGGGWAVYRLADYRSGKCQPPTNPNTSNVGTQSTRVTGASPNPDSKTPSAGRRWVKEKASKYLRKSKSTPSTEPVEVDFKTGYTLLERTGSIDNIPPLPQLLWKPSREVLTKDERESREGRTSQPVETASQVSRPLEKLKTTEERPVSTERATRAQKTQSAVGTCNSSEATFVGSSTSAAAAAGGIALDYSSSEDADSEMPPLSPSKRGGRKKRTLASSRMKESAVAMKNQSNAEQDQDNHQVIVNMDPRGKTPFPFLSNYPSTRNARNSQMQNKNILHQGSITYPSPPSPSPKTSTEKRLVEDPFSNTNPESPKTLPANRMSGGRPPIPYRSSKRFASSQGNATRPRHLNNKMASHGPSLRKAQAEASATPGRSGTQPPEEGSSKQAKSAHITPRNANAMSRIPRASPLAMASATAGTGTPGSSLKSPVYVNRRSSIPIPKRMLADGAKVSGKSPENNSSAKKEDNSSEENNAKREDDSDGGSEEIKIYQASEVSLIKVEGSDIEKSGDVSEKEAGYRVKRLSVTGHGPTLRISASADKVIMGRGLEKDKAPAQKLKANSERRHSWNPRETALLKDRSYSKPSMKSLLSPRPVSSIGSVSKNDGLADGIETAKLKKAKSADLSSPTSSRSSPGTGSQKTEIRKTSPFFKPQYSSRRPSPLREGVDASSTVSRESTRTPVKGEATKSTQSRHSKIATRSDRTPSVKSTSRDGKEDIAPSVRRVSKPIVKKNEAITPAKSTPSNKKTPETTPPDFPARGSSRKPATNPTLTAKSKLAHVKNVNSVSNAAAKDKPESPSAADKPEVIEPSEFGLNEKSGPGIKRGSAAAGSSKTGISTAKNSISRGMLSNFKGLFGKPKNGNGIPESSTTKSLRPKFSSTLTRSKSSKGIKGDTTAVGASVPSGTSSRSGFERGNRSNTPPPRPLRFPELEFPGNGDVNALTMDILDSAQRETDTSVKRKLIKLGRVLVEAINHSNDAEKSMIQAMQAARQAEVYSTMTKQNVMQIGHAVQELRNHGNEVDAEYDPNNVI